MFSKKLGFALGAVMIFLAGVAFILGRPAERDPRIYPIVKQYSPFKVENSLGGLKILRKDKPDFKEEPSAVNFYHRLEALERQWGQKHLHLQGMKLEILDDRGNVVRTVELRNDRERRFVESYYGVKAQ